MKKKLLLIFIFVLCVLFAKAQVFDTLTRSIYRDSTNTFEKIVDTFLTSNFEPRTPPDRPKNSSEYWYNMWSSPRFKKATLQRDSLYTISELLKQDTALLRKDSKAKADSIRILISQNEEGKKVYNTLQKEHEHLKITADHTTSQLTGTIDQKNKQLLEREKKINHMSNELAQRESKIIDLENQLRRQDSLANALNIALQQALLNFESDDLKLEVKNGKVYVSLFDKLLFKSGKSDVEQAGKGALKKLADVLNKNANIDIIVEGHTDSIPIKTQKYADNWELSTARSLNIVRLLTQSYNVDPKIVKVSAHAEFSPIASNATPTGRSQNRRTEIILTPNLGTLYNMISKN